MFDLEADGLKPTKIWCVSFFNIHTKESFTLTSVDEIRKVISGADALIGHNIIQFDLPVLERLIEAIPKDDCQIIDTFGLSLYLYHDQGKHGLAYWGEVLGIKKPEIEDWHNLELETYLKRCEEDVKINTKLWEKFQAEMVEIYTTKKKVLEAIRYLNFKMKMLRVQEESKWKVDLERLNEVLKEYEDLKAEKEKILVNKMPRVPKIVKRTPPAKPIKKDGTLSKTGENWLEITSSRGLPFDHPEPIEVEIPGQDSPGNVNSHDQIKDWLFSLGWEPKTYKENKRSDGTKHNVPQINLDHGKGLCDSVKALFEKEPALEALDQLSILNHRIPQLRTLRKVAEGDGFARARATGFTNTLRFKHKELVNLPKPEKPFGGIRSVLVVRNRNNLLCGTDLASLEDRLKQHYIWPKDPEYVKSMMRDDFDPHLELAKFAGEVSDDDIKLYNETEDKNIKGIRNIFKNGNYALTKAYVKSREFMETPTRTIMS